MLQVTERIMRGHGNVSRGIGCAWKMHVGAWTQVTSSDTLVPGMVSQDCRIIFGQTPRGLRPHHDGSPPSPEAIKVRRMRCAKITAAR